MWLAAAGKGSNAIVSILHHFFEEHGLGEREVHLHADNCVGQNKNNTMIHYLLWRVLVVLLKRITLSFLIVGHPKFSPDWCFGLLKQRFRRSVVGSVNDLARVVDESCIHKRCSIDWNPGGGSRCANCMIGLQCSQAEEHQAVPALHVPSYCTQCC